MIRLAIDWVIQFTHWIMDESFGKRPAYPHRPDIVIMLTILVWRNSVLNKVLRGKSDIATRKDF